MDSTNKKVLIVISDEDLIDRLISTKDPNIQIIDLDEQKNVNDDIKSNRISKKWIGTRCQICDDQAIGYNYNVLTCAACKTFFGRYVNINLDELECLSNSGQCVISHKIRRKCLQCRLKKCLNKGMKKILMKKKTKSNQVNQLMRNVNEIDSKTIVDTLFSRLSVADWIRIQTIQSSFTFHCDISEEQDNARLNLSNPASAIVSWSFVGSDNAMRFINFFRHINEFEQLNDDDRFILIKYNIFSIFLSSKGYYYKRQSKGCDLSIYKQEEQERETTLLDLCDTSTYDFNSIDKMKTCLIDLTERDPIVISLLSIILMFSPGISMDESEPSLRDPLTIHRIQSSFTEILFNYLIDKYDQIRAEQYFIQLFILILQIQSGTRDLRLFFQYQSIITNTTDQIAPLMKTILHFS